MKAFNSTLSVGNGFKKSEHKAALKAGKKHYRKCKICRADFEPKSSMVSWCSVDCGYELSQRELAKRAAKKERAERADIKRRKEALMTLSDWIAEVQKWFNAFIRARDANKPCICCGKPFEPQKLGGSMDAGHYLSRGSAPHLRFDERNVHGQRKNCNRPGGTTREKFRRGMEARIGLEELEALECDQESRDWTIADLKEMKAYYQAKTKELKAAQAAREC